MQSQSLGPRTIKDRTVHQYISIYASGRYEDYLQGYSESSWGFSINVRLTPWSINVRLTPWRWEVNLGANGYWWEVATIKNCLDLSVRAFWQVQEMGTRIVDTGRAAFASVIIVSLSFALSGILSWIPMKALADCRDLVENKVLRTPYAVKRCRVLE